MEGQSALGGIDAQADEIGARGDAGTDDQEEDGDNEGAARRQGYAPRIPSRCWPVKVDGL
jgi:hypothetical protein